jgi:chromosome segregation ATPase
MEKVNKLQADMATSVLERNTAIEDRAKIFEMMEMLKSKYNTILSEKKAQSQELIKSEEDKLSIARALVELKLEYSQLQEETEKEKFSSLSELVAARNAVVDLDAQILLARTESMTHQENSQELDKALKETQKELSATNASLLEVRDNLRKEEDKNVELGSELLTLVNQKAVIQQKCDELQTQVDKLNVRLSVFESQDDENANLVESRNSELR